MKTLPEEICLSARVWEAAKVFCCEHTELSRAVLDKSIREFNEELPPLNMDKVHENPITAESLAWEILCADDGDLNILRKTIAIAFEHDIITSVEWHKLEYLLWEQSVR